MDSLCALVSVRVKQLLSQCTKVCDFILEILLQLSPENSNWVNVGQKYQALYLRSRIVTRTDTVG